MVTMDREYDDSPVAGFLPSISRSPPPHTIISSSRSPGNQVGTLSTLMLSGGFNLLGSRIKPSKNTSLVKLSPVYARVGQPTYFSGIFSCLVHRLSKSPRICTSLEAPNNPRTQTPLIPKTMSNGPVPSVLCSLSDLPSREVGDKVRFLGWYAAHPPTPVRSSFGV